MHWSCYCRAGFGEQGEGRSSTGPTVYQQILSLLTVAFTLELTQFLVENLPLGSNAQAQILSQDVEIELFTPGMEFLHP